jgi:hypothetical protein
MRLYPAPPLRLRTPSPHGSTARRLPSPRAVPSPSHPHDTPNPPPLFFLKPYHRHHPRHHLHHVAAPSQSPSFSSLCRPPPPSPPPASATASPSFPFPHPCPHRGGGLPTRLQLHLFLLIRHLATDIDPATSVEDMVCTRAAAAASGRSSRRLLSPRPGSPSPTRLVLEPAGACGRRHPLQRPLRSWYPNPAVVHRGGGTRARGTGVADPRCRDLRGRRRATESREPEMEGETRRELASMSSLSFTSVVRNHPRLASPRLAPPVRRRGRPPRVVIGSPPPPPTSSSCSMCDGWFP